MFDARFALCALVLATTSSAQLAISLGIRETEAGGVTTYNGIGGNGGSLGGIEWVDKDTQMLPLDGQWHLFTFDIANGPLTGFAGGTANSILDGTWGTIEHVRILNAGGTTEPITVWIDDVTNTITPMGGTPTPTNFGDFEGYTDGEEVMFQEPSFSGSTASSLVAGSTAGVDNYVASRTASYRADFQFIDGTTTRWLRWTTFNTGTLGNPTIRFDDASVVTFWMRAGTCQPNLGSAGPGTAVAEMCGTGLASGESSTYYVAGGPANVPGAIALSLPGFTDLPLAGGTMVSGFGFALSIGVATDASGFFSLPVPGTVDIADVVVQTVLLDLSLPEGLAITNAVQAAFGQ
ncbi:MAG: hypothetical protein H6834_14090 [Planctomycetes bacterium]|nr:hypothetical protein [Planctomycetota bacterium]